MSAIQEKVIGTALKDPAVQSVGAYIGAGGATSTENQGRIFIALKPKPERAPITEVMARLGQAVRGVVGVRLFMQPVQDIVIGGRLTATQYQYTLTDIDLNELNKWAPIVQNAIGKLPQIIDLTSDQQSAGPQLTLAINRDTAARLGITAAADRRRVVRRLRAAPDRAALYEPQPVFRHHGGEPRLPARARMPCNGSMSARRPPAWCR